MRRKVINDAAEVQRLKHRYIAITRSWTQGATFQPAEQAAMERGRALDVQLMQGPDDPLMKSLLADGDSTYERVAALYPGKVRDRTVLGVYSDPQRDPEAQEEFVLWWNGAVSADLRKTRSAGPLQPVAANTSLLFRVGGNAQMLGVQGEHHSRMTYLHDGVLYEQAAFAESHDIAWAGFQFTNRNSKPAEAELHVDLIFIDGINAPALAHSDPRSRTNGNRISHRIPLKPGQSARIVFRIPYRPKKLDPPIIAQYDAAFAATVSAWRKLLAAGTRIHVPEQRINNVWRALLLQNFVLADGPRFTYGSGLWYNDSYYPMENGFGAHTFAMYGHKEYANALLPYSDPVSLDREGAGRKYQNRRGFPLRHLLENYRLTGRTDTYDKYKADFQRVAEEIIADRRSTMTQGEPGNPLHHGLLPPGKPAVDTRASTQSVYVLAHSITNCQALRDFGDFLTRTGLDRTRGRRYLEEAAAFRKDLLLAMDKAAIRLPDRPPFVDLQTLYFRDTPDYGPDPYDDLGNGRLQGAYFHYWVDMQLQYNFFNPSDPAGKWLADYTLARNGFVLGSTRARPRPETGWGWINNVYNSGYFNYRLRSGGRAEFLLGFHARLAFGMTRNAWIASEGSPLIGYNTHNGGFAGAEFSFPNSAANAETLHMLRPMLILEDLRNNEETGELKLLAGIPSRWLSAAQRIDVAAAPTYFGDISFRTEGHAAGLRATIETLKHPRLRTISLHLHRPIRAVRINGVPSPRFRSPSRARAAPSGLRSCGCRMERHGTIEVPIWKRST